MARTELAGKLSTSRWEDTHSIVRLSAAAFVCFTFIIPLILSQYDYSAMQVFLAMILLGLCLYPLYRYIRKREVGVPVLPLLCIAYAAQFVIPIFTREAIMALAYDDAYLDSNDVIVALAMTIIGILVMQMAYHLMRKKRISNALPAVSLPLNVNRSILYCFSIFLLLQILRSIQTFLWEKSELQFSAIIGLLQNQALVAIGILGWIVYTGRGGKWLKLILYLMLIITVIRNATTTMLESVLVPITVLLIAKWIYSRRVPILGFAFIGVLIVFLSPVKSDIRRSVSENESATDSSVTIRSLQWIEQATDYWVSALTEQHNFLESASDTTSRTDLIHQFTYIYASTPSRVPYQYGESYKYFAVALIPRALWPGKPEANNANNFYAINYGVSTEQVLESTTFGVTLIGEGYMNFGFFGVLLVMFMQGAILSLLEQIFAGPKAGAGGWAIFIASFVFFLNGIGSSAEVMFGAILQNLIFSSILLWWVREKMHDKRDINLSLASLITK
ncbi:MAG: hypothetical protein AUG51_24890 [Acidobacteria bacterium 13_1_20CM_3_53_8]|nr:MAG: hypothetical protein AUG51_24890 [Acidobacteria bacterium 13_1_20CM_3_53_8]